MTETQRASVLRALDARPVGQSICHMDFHPDNILITQAGARIIDWPNVCAGNPWADVARTYLMLTIGEPPPGSSFARILILARELLRRTYLNRYLTIHPDTNHELAAWTPIIAAARLADNIPGEQAKLLAIVQRAYGD
jgi:aminoglycoside phosphotransferase (APT) family kinase protein